MRLPLVLLALPFVVGAGNVAYRCRDVDGRWTEQACLTQRVRGGLGDQPPDPERMKRQREAYLAWCAAREPEPVERDACVLAQMDALAFLTRRLSDAGSGTAEARAVAGCIATHTDAAGGQVDAIAARECYVGPEREKP
jgi:hypothetical protein